MRHRLLLCVIIPAVCVVAVALGWQPARAAGVVTDCSNDAQLRTMLASGGNVSFNCGGTNSPATIVVNPVLVVNSGQTTLDGGGKITLSGANANSVFGVDAGVFGSPLGFTLTHITLTSGYAGTSVGGCMYIGFSSSVVLDNVNVQNCRTEPSGQGGGIANVLGSLAVRNSRFSNNTAGVGGGIRSFNNLTLTNTLLASNHAITGGGLAVSLFPAFISSSTFYSNSATGSGGGIHVDSGVHVRISGSQFDRNRAQNPSGDSFGGGIRSAGTLTVSDSTFSGNTATTAGGGIHNAGTATLNNSTLSGNWANIGGGIDNRDTTTLNNSTVSGNTAAIGGGVRNFNLATLNNSTVSGNAAGSQGGGIGNQGFATLNNSTVSGNAAGTEGGGIINVADAILNNSTVSGNTAAFGGGVYNFDTATLNNSTVSGNSATGSGGGIHNAFAVMLNNSTVSGNSANSGGGLYNISDARLRNVTLSNNAAAQGGALHTVGSAPTVLTNTILAYSPAGGNCFGSIPSSRSKYSLSSDNSCALAGTGDQNLVDPKLTALGNYGGPTLVHMLKQGSPAIAGVFGSDAPLTDQRGMPRPGPDGSYDIGAVEWQLGESDLAPRLFLPFLRR